MVKSHVELYEALKGPVGERAARMIAEVVPPAHDLLTKHDLATSEGRLTGRMAELEVRMSELEVKMSELEVRLTDRMAALESRLMGRLWVMFVPLWVGLYGLIATLIIGG